MPNTAQTVTSQAQTTAPVPVQSQLERDIIASIDALAGVGQPPQRALSAVPSLDVAAKMAKAREAKARLTPKQAAERKVRRAIGAIHSLRDLAGWNSEISAVTRIAVTGLDGVCRAVSELPDNFRPPSGAKTRAPRALVAQGDKLWLRPGRLSEYAARSASGALASAEIEVVRVISPREVIAKLSDGTLCPVLRSHCTLERSAQVAASPQVSAAQASQTQGGK